jgi:TonB family protein
MTRKAPRVPDDSYGSLRSCLVQGDPQSEKRARRIKQRAVAVSVALQTMALTALLLYPLLGKSERISFKYATPIPPYQRIAGNHPQTDVQRHSPRVSTPAPYRYYPPRSISSHIDERLADTTGPAGPIAEQLPGTLIEDEIIGASNRPAPPPDPVEARRFDRTERHKISELQQMAQLVNRVEPAYPKFAIQLRKEGRVELHAIIATDGSIQSLEVVSGDPFFFQSALNAVRQWRYRPTILNGQAIEVDTHITVIYALNH